MNTRFTSVESKRADIRKTKRVAAVLLAMLVASCGGGGGDEGDDTPVYNVKAYFDQFRIGGATYTMEGTFTDISGSTNQRHELVRTPVQLVDVDWQGMSSLRRSKVRVNRFVDGAAGAVDEYSLYFDSANTLLGFQAEGQANYQVLDGTDNIPEITRIGDTGTRKRMSMYDTTGGPLAGYVIVTWEMKESFASVPSYCETETEYSLADVAQQAVEWCYGMQSNGNTTGDISFGYQSSATNFGLLQGANMTPNGPLDINF